MEKGFRWDSSLDYLGEDRSFFKGKDISNDTWRCTRE